MEKKQKSKVKNWVKESSTFKMFVVGFLIIIMLVPLSYIKTLIKERKQNQENVIAKIDKKWGEEVLLYGPIFQIPYKSYTKTTTYNEQTKKYYTTETEHIKNAYFFPDKLNEQIDINTQERHLGIYKEMVFNSKIKIQGNFPVPDFKTLDIKDKNVIWDKAKVIIKTTNLKGITSKVEIKIDENNYSFKPIYNDVKENYNVYQEYTTAKLHTLESTIINGKDLPKEKIIEFQINFPVNGSKQFRIIPIGKETKLNINSNWSTNEFIGSFSPIESEKVTEKGFDKNWKVLHINRPFSQQFIEKLPNLNEFAFGVNFRTKVNEYQKNMRAVKYGFLLIGLTFLIFFLIQSISKINIHPFQYLMIGVALTMFYTLLISITEHSNFQKAYVIAGASVVTLISLYSKSILKNMKFPILIGLSLTSLYTFIYVIIQLENYALLVGSIGLFIILSAVMFVSRKIKWN